MKCRRRCPELATQGVFCAKHAEENRACSAKHAVRRREEANKRKEGTLTARDVGAAIGLSERRIHELAQAGKIPSVPYGKHRRFVLDDVRAVIQLRPDRRTETHPKCTVCKQRLPRDAFLTITVTDKDGKRGKAGYSWTGPSSECRECRKEQRREWRRRKAEKAGKQFAPHGDRAEYLEQCRTVRRQRKAEGMARMEATIAEQKALGDANRQRKAESESLRCRDCGVTKERSEFFESMLNKRGFSVVCAECCCAQDAEKFKRDMETLSDAYVKRQLVKHGGLKRPDIPQILIDAKRAQLAIERTLHPHRRPDGSLAWLIAVLSAGPVPAEELNVMAKAQGIGRETLIRARKKLGAVYDPEAITWEIKQRNTNEECSDR